MPRITTSLWVLLTALTLSGCIVANKVVEPSTTLEFRASTEINPDITGRPSPVVVTAYELRSSTRFDNADFFQLDGDAATLLGDDLLATHEFEIEPGTLQTQVIHLDKAATQLGFIAAYRDIEASRWRTRVSVKPSHYETVDVWLQPLAIEIKP